MDKQNILSKDHFAKKSISTDLLHVVAVMLGAGTGIHGAWGSANPLPLF